MVTVNLKAILFLLKLKVRLLIGSDISQNEYRILV